MDPLSLLRYYHINKKEIVEHEEKVIFGEFSLPRNTKTNYLTYGSGKNGAPQEYYTLECLLFLLKNVHMKHAVYVKKAAEYKIPVVFRPDRKDLLAYLNGKIHTSIACDKYALKENSVKVKRIAKDNLQNGIAKKPRVEENCVELTKQLLAAKLEAPKEVAVSVSNIKSLSEVMTVDKIFAIKTKRLVKKRNTIKENYDIEMESDVRAVLDMDIDETKAIIARERQYKNRNLILQSSKKVFTESIFSILAGIKIREERIQKQKEAMRPTPSMVTPHSIPVRTKSQSTTYNRYDQERFIQRNKETGDFNIDTTCTYHGVPLEFVKAGINPAFRNLHPVAPGNVSAPTPGLLPASAAKFTPQQAAKNKRPSRTPIIIVPPHINTSLITMVNAVDVLQDLKYISPEEKRSQGVKRETDILIQRRKEHGTVPYRVIDNPQKLTKEEWERVVAVFVLGPQWQFKGWPFNGNPVEIFAKISAFHIKYDDMPLETHVASWAVSVIDINKNKKHLHRAAIMRFWEILDKHMVQTKRPLRF